MTIALTTVPYGPPAMAALRHEVASAKAGDPLAPVTVIVPSNSVGVAARRHLAATGGVAAVSFLTVYRLAELVAAPALAASGRRPVAAPVLLAAVRRVLDENPGLFAPVAHHPATAAALLATHRELRDLPASALASLGRSATPRTREVVRVHRDVVAALQAWYDEADVMAAATEIVRAGTAPVARSLGHAVVYLVQDLTIGGADLLRAVASRGPVTVVAGTTGVSEADEGVQRSLRRLGLDPGPVGAGTPAPRQVEVVTASDADEEVRAAVRSVLDAARLAGVPFERMAILYPAIVPYARLLAERLDAAGVPWNGRAARPLRDRVAGRTLLGVLGLADRQARRQEVLALLTDGPLRGPDGRPAPAALWERLTREAGVVRGRSDWDERLAALAAARRASAATAQADPEQAAWRAERAGREAQAADALRALVLELLDAFDPTRVPRSWKAMAELSARVVRRLLGDDAGRATWPDDERAAAARVDAVLDRLAHLDAVDPQPDLERFRQALEAELDADLAKRGRLGEGLLVGPLGLATGLELDVVVVLGLAEGTLPTRTSDDALIPDAERRRLGDLLAPSNHRTGVEHRQLRAAVGSATRAVLLMPRGDLRRSNRRIPSRWLRSLAGEAHGSLLDTDDLDRTLHAPWLRRVPSFAGSLATLDFPATTQEHTLRSLVAHTRQGLELEAHPAAAPGTALRRGIDLVRARRSTAFTVFDGNLAGCEPPSPFDTERAVSPTSLEAWLRCPHAYLVERVLHVSPLEDPAEQLRINPLDRGLLVHEVLDRFLRDALARRGGSPPAPDEPWSRHDHHRLDLLLTEASDTYRARGLTGHDLFWFHDMARIRRDLHRLLERDDADRAALRMRPLGSELAFGLRGEPPLVIELPGGRSIRFRGIIDRVDLLDGGGVVVTDFKDGSGSAYRSVGPANPFGDGTRLQLPLYGRAARRHGRAGRTLARYVMVRFPDLAPGVEVDASVDAQLEERLLAIADAMAAGIFPSHPEPPQWRPWVPCHFCDPDGLGTAERYREWERKRGAPELGPYVALVAPEVTADAG